MKIALVFHKPALTHPAACWGFCTASLPLVGSRPFKWNTTFKIVPTKKERRKQEHSSVFFGLFSDEWRLCHQHESAALTKKREKKERTSQGQEPTYVRKNIQWDKKHYGESEWPWRGQSHVIVPYSQCKCDEWQPECDSVQNEGHQFNDAPPPPINAFLKYWHTEDWHFILAPSC